MSVAAEVTTLNIALDDYPHTLPIKRGEISSPHLALAFTDIKPANRFFKPMVRELKFDVSEMAIATLIQAKAYGAPLVLLPATMMGRFQQGTMLCRAASPLRPSDLAGKRVGVRSYSQTTIVWMRGILQNDYGVDVNAHPMGDPGGRPRRPIPRAQGRGAGRARQEPPDHAARGRDRRRDLWCEPAERPDADQRHSRSRCRGTAMVRQASRRADQPHGGGDREAREIQSGCCAGSVSFTCPWQSCRRSARRRAQSTSCRSVSTPAGRPCRRSLTTRCSKTSSGGKSKSRNSTTTPRARSENSRGRRLPAGRAGAVFSLTSMG